MENHFGKGLMAGMRAAQADTAKNVAHFCADYKRGFCWAFRTGCLRKPAIASLARGRRGF
jgi:hypothetical protein